MAEFKATLHDDSTGIYLRTEDGWGYPVSYSPDGRYYIFHSKATWGSPGVFDNETGIGRWSERRDRKETTWDEFLRAELETWPPESKASTTAEMPPRSPGRKVHIQQSSELWTERPEAFPSYVLERMTVINKLFARGMHHVVTVYWDKDDIKDLRRAIKTFLKDGNQWVRELGEELKEYPSA